MCGTSIWSQVALLPNSEQAWNLICAGVKVNVTISWFSVDCCFVSGDDLCAVDEEGNWKMYMNPP